jgi:D-alanyl-D-alanine carboxypeptidase/D-alanyl-D-alanine-endopeptidase (penicillin-binding protein 4)
MIEGGKAVGRYGGMAVWRYAGRGEKPLEGGCWTHRLVRPILAVMYLVTVLAALPPYRPTATAQSLPHRLDALLDAAPFDRQLWGVALMDDRGHLLFGRNERRLFTPASNTKLVVSIVASALLSPDWKVRTSLYGAGPVVKGALQGDLVLYGRGDPTMSRRCYATDTTAAGVCDRDSFARLRLLADSLKARGIRQINGDLVGDGSYFEPIMVRSQWELFDLNWWYAAPVSGLAFNDNSVDFTWQPGLAPGMPVTITMQPDLGDVSFENRTVTTPAGGVTDLPDRFFRVPGTLQIWAEGGAAVDHPPGTESFALPDPNLYTARALRQVLLEAGISIAGTTRSTTDSALYGRVRASVPLAEVTSRPLRDWIFPILNTSQNLFAEMLLKQLGKQFGKAGSWEEGLAVERRFLIDSVRVDSTEFALVDGSGLAGGNLISPHAFTQLLRYIRSHPRYSTFVPGLPVAGTKGTLRTHFEGTPLARRVRAKSGSIEGVNTLSGYIEPANGKVLIFSIQANHHVQTTKTILAAIDNLVLEMAKKQ